MVGIVVDFNRNSAGDILVDQYVNPVSQIYLTNTTYQNCKTITSINLHNLPFANNETKNAFYGCSNLTSVTGLSNTITSLNYSFALCYSLNNVTIPNSVVDLSRTFTHCTNITGDVIIPNSVQSMDGTFNDTAIESTPIIPDSVVSMSSTFSLCSNLVTVRKFSNNVINMSSTFSYCNRLVNTPTIPNSVIDLSSTFRFCSSITNVSSTIPKSVATLLNTFYDCTNLTGNIYIESTTVVNAQNCFQNTSLPKNVYIPFKTTTQQNLYGFQRGFSMSSIGNTPQLLYTDSLTLSNTMNLYDANGDKVNYAINTYRDNPISGKIFYVYEDNVTYYKYNSAYDLVPGSNTPTYNAFIEAGYNSYLYAWQADIAGILFNYYTQESLNELTTNSIPLNSDYTQFSPDGWTNLRFSLMTQNTSYWRLVATNTTNSRSVANTMDRMPSKDIRTNGAFIYNLYSLQINETNTVYYP